MKNKLKKFVSSVLCITLFSQIMAVPVGAISENDVIHFENNYLVFADNLTVNEYQADINGSVYSENDFTFTGNQNCNVGGTLNCENIMGENILSVQTVSVKEDVPDYTEQLNNDVCYQTRYNSDTVIDNTVYDLSSSLYVDGTLLLDKVTFKNMGYIQASESIKFNAVNDGKNDYSVFLYSENNDITVQGTNLVLNGIIYAPNGKVELNAKKLTVNGMIIGKNVEFNGSELVVNQPNSQTYPSFELLLDTTDTDNDGLSNYLEMIIGTSISSADTDNDGLSDGYELKTLRTDPLKADTDDNNTDDGQEDFDTDGLTNVEEYILGTEPFDSDSDKDDLSDSDEVNIYGTNPLSADTDNDLMSDATEIKLELNPLADDTDGDGIVDSNETITMNVDVDKEKSFDISKAGVVPSLKITGHGDYDRILYAKDISNNETITDIPFIVGHPYEFIHNDDLNFDECTLTFNINDNILTENNITDLMIAWYDEENNTVNPLTTIYDESKKEIYANIEHFSSYIVINKKSYHLTFMNIIPNSTSNETIANISMYNGHYYSVIDESMSWTQAKDYCSSLGGHLVTIQDQNEQSFISELIKNANKNTYWIGLSGEDNHYSWITGEPLVYNNWDMGEPNTLTETVVHMYAKYSGKWNDTLNAYTGAGYYNYRNCGIVCEWESNPQESPNDGKCYILLSNGTSICLDKDPSLGDRTVDTDGDGICDIDELLGKSSMRIFDPYAKISQSTSEITAYTWKFKSNPTKNDTDGDYYPDTQDSEPTIVNNMYICDLSIDDSDFHNGSIISKKLSDEYTDGELIINNEEFIAKYYFYRPSGKISGFSLIPDKTSFYKFTNYASQNASVQVKYEKGVLWWKKTINVPLQEDGTYLLYKGIEYTIYTYGEDSKEYIFTVEQDNWVYAPNGGLLDIVEYSNSSIFSHAFDEYLISEQLYMSSSNILKAISRLRNDSIQIESFKGDDIENQIRFILDNNGMSVSTSELHSAILSIMGAAAQVVLIIVIPGGKAKAGCFIISVLANGIANSSTFIGGYNGIKTVEDYFEQCGFKRSCLEGNLNVVSTHFISGISGNVWDGWTTAPYIRKISMMGDIGKFIAIKEENIPQFIIDWCEWSVD